MTPARTWIDGRADGVPSALVAHVRDAVRTDRDATAAVLCRSAVDMLSRALSAPTMTRAHALDVLGADALMTYALEAAADDPDTLTARADAAMAAVGACVGDDA